MSGQLRPVSETVQLQERIADLRGKVLAFRLAMLKAWDDDDIGQLNAVAEEMRQAAEGVGGEG